MFYKSMIWKIPESKPTSMKIKLFIDLVMKTGFVNRYD